MNTPYLNKLLEELGVEGEIVNNLVFNNYTTDVNGFFIKTIVNKDYVVCNSLSDVLIRNLSKIEHLFGLYLALTETFKSNSPQPLEEWAKTLLTK